MEESSSDCTLGTLHLGNRIAESQQFGNKHLSRNKQKRSVIWKDIIPCPIQPHISTSELGARNLETFLGTSL